jgi:hypothetical protein
VFSLFLELLFCGLVEVAWKRESCSLLFKFQLFGLEFHGAVFREEGAKLPKSNVDWAELRISAPVVAVLI